MLNHDLGFAAACLVSHITCADVFGTLVLYAPQPNADAQKTFDAFTAKHPDVEVEWTRDGTTKVMAKLRAVFAAGVRQPEGHLIPHAGAVICAYDPAQMDLVAA